MKQTSKKKKKSLGQSLGETFTRSECDCDICKSMHIAQLEWDTFTPKTKLQFKMKKVVQSIQDKLV